MGLPDFELTTSSQSIVAHKTLKPENQDGMVLGETKHVLTSKVDYEIRNQNLGELEKFLGWTFLGFLDARWSQGHL